MEQAEKCPKCGSRLTSQSCERCANKVILRIVHRELALLILLAAITVPLFVFTRSMAARNRAMNVEVGAAWYAAGQKQLKAGNLTAAIDAFRNAATNDHNNRQFVLALATTLGACFSQPVNHGAL